MRKYSIWCIVVQMFIKKKFHEYKGAKLVYLPLNANGWQSVLYDSFSLVHAFCVCDVILSLGTVGSFILPFLLLVFP